jgi:hypothetical protein
MVPRRFDLKMEGCHVVEEAGVHGVIGINTRLREMRGRTAEEASDKGLRSDWISEPDVVRTAGGISLGGCHETGCRPIRFTEATVHKRAASRISERNGAVMRHEVDA